MLEGTPTTISDFTARLGHLHRPLIERLARIVENAAPEAEGTIKWGMPVYSTGRNVVYLEARSREYVSLGFFRGADLDDPEGLLEGSGSALRYIRVSAPEQIPEEAIRQLVRQAFDRAQGRD